MASNPWRAEEANYSKDVPPASSLVLLFKLQLMCIIVVLFFFFIILAGKFPGQIIPYQYIISTKVIIFKLMV